MYQQNGQVDVVAKVVHDPLDLPSPSDIPPLQVLVRMLAAPINPADINMIEGVYHINPPMPAVGGNEGVGVIESVGQGVTELKIGDWVLPAQPGFGTWRQFALCSQDAVTRVPNTLKVEDAATMAVNPCTALRLLADFINLKPGNVIIQNGANSGVGQSVIQIAKKRGIRTINVIRAGRPNMEATKKFLIDMGADVVVTDETLQNKDEIKAITRELGDKKGAILGLNCVGGRNLTDMSRIVPEGATIVTYGGMSRKPVTVSTSVLIFNDLHLRGFWLSRWTQNSTKQQRDDMLQDIARMYDDGHLRSHTESFALDDFAQAFATTKQPYRNKKVLLKM